ncbi:MAG: Glycosyltransferase, group 1 family protein [Microgenomates group bacterium GW2011_GWC1_38_12]|nr:MAG: Glycosyltransferase, group 1 family protein [Microgenomates group bacterium GW2011_GWC1_38_12]
MKVLFLTRLYWPHVGGVEKHVYEIGKRLKVKGKSVTIITEKYDKHLNDEEIKDGIKIIRIDYPKIKYLGIFYIWFWLLKNITLIKESDIVHVHDVFIWYWPFKILLPRKKVFLTFHGRWGVYPIPFTDILQKRIGARFSNGLICIGDYIPKSYGIRSDTIAYGATYIPKNIPKKDKKSIIYVGRLDKDIALKKYFSVIKKLKGYKIEFCGQGELASEASLYGEVKGFVDPKPYMQKAKYCFASGYLTILEALANKCLVFKTYDNALQKKYFELTPFSKFIITSNNPRKLYDKFKYYEKNSKVANKLIEKGYNWVKWQTWEKLAQDYLNLWAQRRQ